MWGRLTSYRRVQNLNLAPMIPRKSIQVGIVSVLSLAVGKSESAVRAAPPSTRSSVRAPRVLRMESLEDAWRGCQRVCQDCYGTGSYPLPTNHLTFSSFPNTEALVSSMCWYYSALHRIIMWKAREEELRVLSSQPWYFRPKDLRTSATYVADGENPIGSGGSLTKYNALLELHGSWRACVPSALWL